MSDLIERQQAIDAFKTVNLLCGLDGKGRPIEQDDLRCQITGTLLKVPPAQRDIPKKPNETIDRSWGISTRQAVCPNCDAYLGMVHFIGDGGGKKIAYCESCGQAIDWTDWEEEDGGGA